MQLALDRSFGRKASLNLNTKSLILFLQDVRTALLQLLVHMVVANSALVPLCLQVLVLAMQPPSVPPKQGEEAAVALAAWQPASETVKIQSEVVSALEKVTNSTACHQITSLAFWWDDAYSLSLSPSGQI